MVSEESCRSASSEESIKEETTPEKNFWTTTILKDMPVDDKNDKRIYDDFFISQIVEELLDRAWQSSEGDIVMTRSKNLSSQEKIARDLNRNTSIVVEDWDDESPVECRNGFLNISALQRSASERVISRTKHADENDNIEKKTPKEKKKKRLSFHLFGLNRSKSKEHHKNDEESEKYDNFSTQLPVFTGGSLGKSRKFASALELSNPKPASTLHKSNSVFKKLLHIGDDSTKFLKRSLSFRDVRKKEKEPVKDKQQEWKQSLQSLVESDTSVSYKDLSFIDYDVLNEFSYDEPVQLRPGGNERSIFVGRTQSMREKGSPHLKRHPYSRHTSITPEYRSSLTSINCLKDNSASSLPSLSHIISQDNVETLSGSSPETVGRRHHSIYCDDGQNNQSSFRSAGSGGGYSKLRRHNATRQKIRHPATFIENRQRSSSEIDRKVRSRSLNHLDSLEMRQAVVSTGEAPLKDSKSEPDCTRPLHPPPSTPVAAVDAQGTSATTSSVTTVTQSITQIDGHAAARKHMLSRSQKSSSECFSVNFEVGDESTWDNELFFPAQRGITLHDSLSKLCELRNIDLAACDARLQDKENNSEVFILFTQDTASLVGRHIRITAKEQSNKKYSGSFHSNHSRKQSGNYRPRTSSFFSSSTEDPNVISSTLSLHEADQNKKQIKQRLTAFFGNNKDFKYEALIEQLDRYSRQGIPQNVDYPQGQCESIDALYKLEDDWRDIIADYNDLNDRLQQQQTALWELIKTEVAYIKTLKVVTDLFLGCLRDLQSKNLFKEIDTEKLFSNVTEILGANVIFWRNTLFPLVRDMRKHRRPACLENMLEGFSKIHDIFQPYFKYCAEQSRCQHYCRENLDSEVFTAYLTWCESQKDCNRLRLMDILVQPMQRLTKYGLLLKAILKNTEEDVERESLQAMIKMVDDFVNNVNSSLKHRQDKERLKGIIARIESYDIVESKDDDIERILKKEKSLTQLDLTRPMLACPPERKRHLLLEGDLKLKDSGASKIEVHCFLLTDMLLICKPSTKKGGATMRVIRQPYLVDRLVIHELNRETPSLAVIYRNEFDMAVAAFILQSNDSRKIKGWKEGIAKAQVLYAQAKQLSSFGEESLDADYNLDYNLESDYHSLQLAPRSPMASSSRASRVSSLAHSHSGSVEMNDQSSIGSAKDQSRGVSIENENRTGSISSDEGLQSLPADVASKSPVAQKSSLKTRLFHKTPNTLSVQPVGSLGQSLPNLTLGSPNIGGGLTLNLNQNTLSVPSNKNGSHLLSPTQRGISYPPPSPTRGNLRRSLAISQSKNPPLIKTRQVNSASSVSSSQIPTSFDFDVPVIAGISQPDENCDSFNRGQHRQAMKRTHRYHTAGLVDDIKKNDSRDTSIHKRLSWNCSTQDQRQLNEDQT
ncbi:pleckstrin homology domain-containing family G member 5 isoform X1 [Sitophilus oryzae]|uniref:Pleckstrin homology domain-containing family G member 5 isoform X1 n=1 Tax=Sitophilus oryzae TaxID=7048 RepID=A0A6J2Y3I4_SITOR|nr:pleckstrin homology domain-containing family G member 5 isoform X1 [Sitophilus oryzae]